MKAWPLLPIGAALCALAGCPRPGPRVRVQHMQNVVVTSNGELAVPRLLESDPPEFPTDARLHLREGTVVVQVAVGEDGRVHEATVVKSDHGSFDSAALAAVRRWRWAIVHAPNGKPISWSTTVALDFRLNARVGSSPAMATDVLHLEGSAMPRAVLRVDPEFRGRAKKHWKPGHVKVRIVVDESGRVIDAAFIEGEPDLARRSLEAAREWRFVQTGSPWTTVLTFPVNIRYYYKSGGDYWRIKPSGPVPPPAVRMSDAVAVRRNGTTWESVAVLRSRPSHVARALPPQPTNRGEDGEVAVRLIVGTSGQISDARILRSAPDHDAEVLESLNEWRFERMPTAWMTTATFTFRSPR